VAVPPPASIDDADSIAALIETLDAESFIARLSARHPAFMLSKTKCPFCTRTKALFAELEATVAVVELDPLSEEAKLAVQAYMKATTGAGTVPRVFVGSACLGGFTETQRELWTGELVPLLVRAGALDASTSKAPVYDTGNPLL